MVNRDAEADQLLRESLHAAGDRWEPDRERALLEIRRRTEHRARRGLEHRLQAVIERFRSRPLALGTAVAVLALSAVLVPSVIETLRDPNGDTLRHVVAGPDSSHGTARDDVSAADKNRDALRREDSQRDEVLWRQAETQRIAILDFGPDMIIAVAAGTVVRVVPDIRNVPLPAARDRLQHQRLRVRVLAARTEGELTNDVVTDQYPAPGENLPVNGAVTLKVRTSCPACLQAQGATLWMNAV
jgi:hypothetical protein